MVSEKVTVVNATGLHLRPAGILCKEAMRFKSNIVYRFGGGEFNAKSVLSILGGCVKRGDEIEICCDGEDEDVALRSIVESIRTGLGE